MERCVICSKNSLLPEKIDGMCICKMCFLKIKGPVLKKGEYKSCDDVKKRKDKVMAKLSRLNCPYEVMGQFQEFFNDEIEKMQNFVCLVKGGLGQNLKVHKDHCVLITTNAFDEKEVSVLYAKLLKKQAQVLPTGIAVAKDFLTGGIIKTGLKYATSAAINAIAPDQEKIDVVVGERFINYSLYSCVEYQPALELGDDDLGFLKFKSDSRGTKDVMFFFSNDSKKGELCADINRLIEKSKKIPKSNRNMQPLPTSAADELLKFKSLLDSGVITQKEFDAKKKELLKMKY